MLGGRCGVLQVYWMRLYMILEGHMAFSAERVGSDWAASESHGGEEKQTDRPWCPDGRIALSGRGDDDDAALEVIGLTGTGVPTATFCTECLG